MFPPDTYPSRHAPDPALETGTVLRLVRRHAHHAAAVTGIDESGGEARVYLIDDDLVLKTQRPQQIRARTSLAKEVQFLDALAGESGVHIPRALGHGHDGNIEYTLMTRMPGVAASAVTVEGAARTALLHALGRMLRRIHAIPQQPFFASPLFPGVRNIEAFETRLREGFERAVGMIEREHGVWTLSVSPRALAARAIEAPRLTVDLVALHSNPGPQHVFIDPVSQRLHGLIDFGDAYIAHPGFDVRWPRPEDRATLLAGYTAEEPVSDTFLRAWYASMALADLTTFATRPNQREVAIRTIEAIVARL